MDGKYGVVRFLWGDMLTHRRRVRCPNYYVNLLYLLRESKDRGDQTDIVYCWGKDNYDFCKYVGFENVVLFSERKHIYGERAGALGTTLFIHKWDALLNAFDRFSAVVSVDWDFMQVQPISDAWWKEQEAYGVPFRAKLFKTTKSYRGAFWRGSVEQSKFIPHCGCGWFGDKEIVKEAKEASDREMSFSQQQSLAKAMDQRNDQIFLPPEEYKKLGYEADFVDLGPRQTPIFENPEGKTIWTERLYATVWRAKFIKRTPRGKE